MGLINKIKEPIFLKESSEAQRQLTVLKSLEAQLSPEGKEKLHQDMKYLEYGIAGEKQIAYELKNSHMPMYILHDIYLQDGDLSAQIDYIVVTRKICFFIECKNLYGDIEINNKGEFIRTLNIGRWKKKEGIYSPITQNERHLELLKKLRKESASNIVSRMMTEKLFDELYKSIVVLANPKTVLNARYAKKEIKDKVIRADQLITYIKEQYQLSKRMAESDEKMKLRAESILKLHKETKRNYTQKYQKFLLADQVKDIYIEGENGELFQELKAYRLQKSREEKIKPYFIYNDSQLKDLISKMPKSKQELQGVSGFGAVKAEKYGDDILKILEKHFC